ncbi:TPA: DUF550 domain-containing protein [Salmonella enterica]|nr:DUF550 domain-containing protein [Salmonella enterica]
MTTITKEWLQQTIAEFENTRDDIPFGLSDDDAKILIVLKRALALLDAEPVAYNQVQRDMMKDIIMRKMVGNLAGEKLVMDDIHAVTMALIDAGFRTAPPASERERIRREHAEWSDATFGNVGPVGPLKHLSKEALEAAADPSDSLEWADMQFLLWDAQRRMGISDEFITRAMIEKLEINKSRQWPEPKDGEPRLHIKEQPAPVVTFYRDGIEAAAKWIDQQREGYDSEHGRHDPDTGSFEFGNDAQREYSTTLEELAEGIRALHPNAGNSPVIPDCWIPVSERLPEREVDVQVYCPEKKEQMVAYLERNERKGYFRFATWRTGDGIYCQPTHWMPLPAAPQEVNHG